MRAGDPAPDGSGPLELARGIEIGHIFQLGRKYARALGLQVLDVNGKQVTVTMGSYGIGVSRVMAALAEANHDDVGLAWPAQVAPAHVHVVATGKDAAVFEEAERIVAGLAGQGVEVLYDDRPKVSPGVKFKDAELLGVPLIVVVGRGLAEGIVEVRPRAGGDPRRSRSTRSSSTSPARSSSCSPRARPAPSSSPSYSCSGSPGNAVSGAPHETALRLLSARRSTSSVRPLGPDVPTRLA